MTVLAKIRDLMRPRPPTMDDELHARHDAEVAADHHRDLKVSQYSGGGGQYNAGAEIEAASHGGRDSSSSAGDSG